MQVTIFGATGIIGKQLVLDGLALNHTVVAYGRNVFELDDTANKNLLLKQGTMFDDKAIRNALMNTDAVICALEGGTDGEDFTRSLGTKHITAQMKEAGVYRIIYLGGTGVMDGPDEEICMFEEEYPEELLPLSAEHLKALQTLEVSELDWTYIATEKIIPGEPDGLYIIQPDSMPETENPDVSVGNLSLFCYNELTDKNFLQKRVGISNA